MGQAKQRGTFEQRKLAAMIRDAEAVLARAAARKAAWDAMTPEQQEQYRERRRESAQRLAMLQALGLSLGALR